MSFSNILPGSWIGFDLDKKWKFDVVKETKESRCTCGVKFTGGICSDWCDTNNPSPDTEELPF